MRASAFLLVAALCATAARAGDNDLELFRLGHPDSLPCTKCDGSPGDAPEAGDLSAQARYHRFASTLGLAFIPPFQETAQSTGQAGFEVGFSTGVAFPRIAPEAWPTSGTQATAPPPQVLVFPTVTVRKGLGASFEVGTAISYFAGSQMVGLTGELRWAPIDGLRYVPDLAVRAFVTRVVGSQALDLTVGGVDACLSKSVGLGGMVKLQPYAQGGLAMVNALTGVIDFRPGVASVTNPTAHDGVFRNVNLLNNRYFRATAGLRLVAGAVVLGLEGGVALGTNAIQSDDLPAAQCSAGSCKAPREFVRVWSSAARLGFVF